MIRINVKTSKKYDVILGNGLLDSVGTFCKEFARGTAVAVVTDENVAPLYLDTVVTSLQKDNFRVFKLIIPGGEQNKSFDSYSKILNFLSQSQIKRNDFVIALGGGIIGDMAGFAAATYLRGIDYMQIPTTLLAVVDSSVGGKTAINLPFGKNLVGSFHQPSMVLADIDTFNTLNPVEIKNGLGEVMKYAILTGNSLFNALINGDKLNPDMLENCINYKRFIVETDEFETGSRKLLNLGHTFGHAIEKLSGYTVPHGIAVVYGLRLIAKASVKLGELSEKNYTKIIDLLDKYDYSPIIPYDLDSIAKAAVNDKKSHDSLITLATIKDIGDCKLTTVPVSSLKELIS